MRRRFALLSLLFIIIGTLIRAAPAQAVNILGDCNSTAAGDYNMDGNDDLAVGVPGEDVENDSDNEIDEAGAVNVIYGDGGLSLPENQFFDQEDLEAGLETNDLFGSCLAAGDFNGDDISDLAIGAPGEDRPGAGGVSQNSTGAVFIIYGTLDGLDSGGPDGDLEARFFDQDTTGVPGKNEAGDFFGASLIAGNFDDDEGDDLAIGSPGEAIKGRARAGAVVVILSASEEDGLKVSGTGSKVAKVFYQSQTNIAGASEAEDVWGSSLASGDFDGDGEADLAIGAPGEDIGTANSAGLVHVMYGSTGGIGASRNRLWHQDSNGIQDAVRPGEFFGAAVASGDFNDDTVDDIAVGVPGENTDEPDGGMVQVLLGEEDKGIQNDGDLRFTQADNDLAGSAEGDDDEFGSALTVGDFDGDGVDDLAVGVPSEDVDDIEDTGAVDIFAGTADEFLLVGFDYITQDVTDDVDAAGVAFDDPAEKDDFFGSALTSGDFAGDGTSDLIVGAYLQDDTEENAGAIEELPDADPTASVFWTQDSDDGIVDGEEIEDEEEEDDFFGAAVG